MLTTYWAPSADKTQGPLSGEPTIPLGGGNESAPLGSRDQGDWLSGKVQEGFLEEVVLNAQRKQDVEGEKDACPGRGSSKRRGVK